MGVQLDALRVVDGPRLGGRLLRAGALRADRAEVPGDLRRLAGSPRPTWKKTGKVKCFLDDFFLEVLVGWFFVGCFWEAFGDGELF